MIPEPLKPGDEVRTPLGNGVIRDRHRRLPGWAVEIENLDGRWVGCFSDDELEPVR